MAEYIDKAEVLRLIEEHKSVGYEMKDKTGYDAYVELYLLAHDHIKEAVERVVFPADVAPVKRGKWLYSDDLYETLVCSSCDYDTEDRVRYRFCPNCGAKMEVADGTT